MQQTEPGAHQKSWLSKDSFQAALQRFHLFITVAQKAKWLTGIQALALQKQATTLRSQIDAHKLKGAEALEALNALIFLANSQLKKPLYPPLDGVSAYHSLRSSVYGFEVYLNALMEANILTLTKQMPLFEQTFGLWDRIQMQAIAQAVVEWSVIVQACNQLVPHAYHYPMPHLKEFE